jgi:hypothetical protein
MKLTVQPVLAKGTCEFCQDPNVAHVLHPLYEVLLYGGADRQSIGRCCKRCLDSLRSQVGSLYLLVSQG